MAADVGALVVSPPAAVWGAQLYLLDQVAPLRDRGIHLTLASPAGSPFADAWVGRGYPLVDLPLQLHEGLRLPGSEQRPGVKSMLRSGRGVFKGIGTVAGIARAYDMMYSFSLRSHLEGAIAGRRCKTPVALDLVNIVRPGLGRYALRAAAGLATLTVANSRASANVLGKRTRVRIIHPGIDLGRFHPAPRDEALRAELTGSTDRPLVAIIGRIDVSKGIDVLVDAMAALGGAAADARLVVVGEAGTGPAEYAERVREKATELLGDRVLFTGRRSDVPAILRAVDVLVVASLAEPFGLSALEAQACRTAVIGTDAGGLVEFVEHEVTGLLVPPSEAAPMARAIERVLTDDLLRERMIDEAERRANPERGLDAQYDELAAMYRDVATRAVRR
jgi:glycosyltransferase involved in cell wall biosynthesis